MIVTKRQQFDAVCRQRGYDLAAAMACVVAQDGDTWTIDETNEAYPRARRSGLAAQPATFVSQPKPPAPPAPAPENGPGTELKAILRNWLGIVASPNCSCNARARQMDEWGPDECERRIPEIVTWLEEQAKVRKLPFVRFAGEQAVKLAIRRARKKAAK